jgi:uncharacterized protein (TIGR04255 family)
MKIPKKISPDSIKTSVIEVRYNSALPLEVLIGLFYRALDDNYTYSAWGLPVSGGQSKNNLTLNFPQNHIFFTDKITLTLHPKKFVFNCLKDYHGWDVYRKEIENTFKQLSPIKEIESYSRIGVRYVSEYPNTDLRDCVKFSFTFGMPEVKSDVYTFHSEFIMDGHKLILNLNSKVPIIQQSESKATIVPMSTIDIDVIKEGLMVNNVDDLLKEIDAVHMKEKEIFFKLLKEDFLTTLKPEY